MWVTIPCLAAIVNNLTLGGADGSDYYLSGGTTLSGSNGSITPKALTVSGITASNKIYDGSSSATVSTTGAVYAGLVSGDMLSVSSTGTFSNKNVGNGKIVTLSSSYSGADVGNYTITGQSGTTANITPAILTAIVTAPNKVYDGNTTSTPMLAITGGLVGNETVTASGTATFNSKDVATANLVTVNNTVLTNGSNGGLASNYVLASGETVAAHITPATLTLSGTAASNKVYDGSTNATLTGGTLNGMVAGDTVTLAQTGTFASKNVGTGIPVTVTDNLSGSSAGNYILVVQPTGLAANITQLSSVTWIGGATGSWSDPANWAGGAIPDLSNVANVVIPNGSNVIFDSTVAGPVNLNQINSGGLTVNSGTLNISNALNLQNYNQSGGLVEGSGSFTVTNAFAQTGSILAMGGNVTITQATGDLSFVNISGNNVNLNSPNGAMTLGTVNTTGNLTANSNGALNLGTSTVGGNLTANSVNGNVTQSGALAVTGTTGITAGTGNVTLANTGNTLGSVVSVSGNNVTLDNN